MEVGETLILWFNEGFFDLAVYDIALPSSCYISLVGFVGISLLLYFGILLKDEIYKSFKILLGCLLVV